jgi:2-keto-4-pentenoate hydratase/2-oxohepta-3-ene-1,7-dioic acid hydratase in catechol pathway
MPPAKRRASCVSSAPSGVADKPCVERRNNVMPKPPSWRSTPRDTTDTAASISRAAAENDRSSSERTSQRRSAR